MPQETVGYVRLEWTCPNCQTRNPGPQKTCGGCGAAQPENVVFESAVQDELIADEKEIARAKAGPDVHCAFCGARNPAGTTVCTQCGADLSEGKARTSGAVVGALRTEPVAELSCPSCGAANPAAATRCVKCGSPISRPKPEAAPARPAGCSRGVLIGVGVGLLAIIAGLIVLFTRTTDLVGTVQSAKWTRSIGIEQFMYVTRSDWRDQIPAAGMVSSCELKVRRVQDQPAPNADKVCGTPYKVDKGSGYAEVVQDCEYHVKDDWCDYRIRDWVLVEPLTASGTDFAAYWPELQLGPDQREAAGQRQEKYEITFLANDKTYVYTTQDHDQYTRCRDVKRWTLKVNMVGGVNAIEPAGG